MKLRIRLTGLATTCCLATALSASAQSPDFNDSGMGYDGFSHNVQQVGYFSPSESSCDCGACDSCQSIESCQPCDQGCDPCGGCGSGCSAGGLFDHGCLCDQELGDPLTLFGSCGKFSMGGWAQMGYHDKNNILFNGRKHDYQLHQGWIYAEKSIDTSNGFDIGGRMDYLYGTDGPDTQAFGKGDGDDHWDNSWDHGADYGHAIPQLYLEAGYGDWSAKVGHFFTIIGNEVVPAPSNFFYSHAYTMYNSEPFTHTGALLTYQMSEDVEVYGGWVFGWDSGFEDNGDAFLGGSTVTLTDDIKVTSTSTIGRFGEGPADERGYMHSTVATIQLCQDWQYIFQNDFLDTEDSGGNTVRDTVGINQYLIHTLCDRLSYGARFEWWNVSGDSRGYYNNNFAGTLDEDFDIFALTLGINIKPCANVIIRPEYRWDWVDGNRAALAAIDLPILEDNDNSQQTFGIDSIFLF